MALRNCWRRHCVLTVFYLISSPWMSCAFLRVTAAGDLPPCTETEYYFEYTECDSTGSRWRVAIPRKEGTCSGLPDPTRGTQCGFSCKAGEFLEMSTQQCTRCAPGTFSLGSGIRFDEWDDIPAGFTNVATYTDAGLHDDSDGEVQTCKNSSWTPQGSYLESNRDECMVSLIYTVHLTKQGFVSFEYQHVDGNIVFEFFIQNDQCLEMDRSSDQKWVKLSSNGDWASHTVNLKSGTNILYWRTTGILFDAKMVKPVLLKNIQIEGVAYMSECFQCKPGTFSRTAGSSVCELCPRNTYSSRGASSCTACNPEVAYAPEGAAECRGRPPCSRKDYFEIHTPCDSEGKTQIMYKWIEPKICIENMTDAVILPPSGERQACPPCNPGFYNNETGSCLPCPLETFSDGTDGRCQRCPAGREPVLGYEYRWWNVLPSNMKTSCFNVGNSDCDQMNAWEVAGDHIRSGVGSLDNDYLILNLRIPGFKLPTSVTGSTGNEISHITFVFETACSANCELYFMMDMNRKSTNIVESWEGSKEKQSYTYIITQNASMSFTWAFRRTNQALDGRQFVDDVVKIYAIMVTNVLGGVATSCRACALESQQPGSSCIPCPAGHYIDVDTNQCRECPPSTYLSGHHIYGKGTCIPCGPGSKSNKEHSACFSDCSFSHGAGKRTLTYNFSRLGPVASIVNGPSFTSKGTKYFHFFKISLCGQEGRYGAVCTDNVTDLSRKDLQKNSGGPSKQVESFICQSTIIPSDGRGFRTALSSQSVSLADIFLGATVENALAGISVNPGLFPEIPKKVPDVNFFYWSPRATSSCENGRNAVVMLRCYPESSASGELSVPRKCPAGTCDGCTFHFLWESSSACPLCTEMDFHEIEGACTNGIQDKHYVWNDPKLCTGGVQLPAKKTSACESIDFWLKAGVGIGIFMGILLTAITCYFWKKNKKLEYKYSFLVRSTNRQGEFPTADSCAIMEGEDNEDELVYSSKLSLLGRFRTMVTKESSEKYECVQLKSSGEHGWVCG
ncbi:endosome/lysosome-associated apoptosis and autophagy regulator family member 2-like isoform X1 [Brienomyrus brachyistius]|uniref:endosome/lysosome-associated apoptosis and autophagy regulator family member 2-like isoform X1 n=1 Tax=Brienomyrus brachyistius TaxID=42636 RepID=UPI0020B3BDE1|nr:endosome/lysosome-associated apoptosis and autophagy regulator family member 2-like isoform X1 [Brienomyrus brachyistius]